jgi:hypothetical protein
MAATNEILARLAQWARAIEAHDWPADALTHREFAADLAALRDAVAAKDTAIEDLIEYGYVGPDDTPPAWLVISDRAYAARG